MNKKPVVKTVFTCPTLTMMFKTALNLSISTTENDSFNNCNRNKFYWGETFVKKVRCTILRISLANEVVKHFWGILRGFSF